MNRPPEVHTIFAGHALPKGNGTGKNWDQVRAYIAGLEEENRQLRAEIATLRQSVDWLMHGETGLSSKCIVQAMLGVITPEGSCDPIYHPHDPADLRRCMLLLDKLPQWRSRLQEMATVSPAWAALAKKWPELERMLREEMAAGHKAPRTYEAMKLTLTGVRA